jgi:hypothetical protein
MRITLIYDTGFQIRSKADALKFYSGVQNVFTIPYSRDFVLRIEPGRHFSVVSKQAISDGTACMIPSIVDDDGIRAYRYRKYINAYLRRD